MKMIEKQELDSLAQVQLAKESTLSTKKVALQTKAIKAFEQQKQLGLKKKLMFEMIESEENVIQMGNFFSKNPVIKIPESLLLGKDYLYTTGSLDALQRKDGYLPLDALSSNYVTFQQGINSSIIFNSKATWSPTHSPNTYIPDFSQNTCYLKIDPAPNTKPKEANTNEINFLAFKEEINAKLNGIQDGIKGSITEAKEEIIAEIKSYLNAPDNQTNKKLDHIVQLLNALEDVSTQPADDIIDALEVQKILGFSARTYYRHRNEFNPIKIGSKDYFSKTEINKHIKRFLR